MGLLAYQITAIVFIIYYGILCILVDYNQLNMLFSTLLCIDRSVPFIFGYLQLHCVITLFERLLLAFVCIGAWFVIDQKCI